MLLSDNIITSSNMKGYLKPKGQPQRYDKERVVSLLSLKMTYQSLFLK